MGRKGKLVTNSLFSLCAFKATRCFKQREKQAKMHSDGFHPRTALPEDGLGAGEMPRGGVPSTRDPPVLKHPQAVHHGTVEKCNASPYFRNLAVWHKQGDLTERFAGS